MKNEIIPTDVWVDGGVILKNPSPHGGTWCYVSWLCRSVLGVAFSQRLHVDSGYYIDGRNPVTNNQTELYAALKALEYLPPDWAGTIHTDSKITMFRLTRPNAGMKGIPKDIVDRLNAAKVRVGNNFTVRLLAGHPTKKQLKEGIGRHGLPVHAENVFCDRRCQELSKKFQKEHGLALVNRA